ncbi:phage tail length tape measure family protein [Aminobacter sp. SR38]|jgi:GH24 family phage-related lysozyme (muramidase)|nr:phage tail length tape measure family protein [Aminobacter sp. SR38]
MAATAEDQARLLVSIEATQKRFEKQMAVIAKSAGDSATNIEQRFKKANDNAAKSFDTASKRSTASVRQTQAAVANLSFQLNDIAMGLASGTSPFTIMVQQGSQVSQALSMAGGGLGGAVRALGGAFASMVNPVSLATFAVIGLGGAAVQYFASLLGDSERSEEKLKEQAQLIQKIADKWGDAIPALKAYNDEVQNALELADIEASGKAASQNLIDKAQQELAKISSAGEDLMLELSRSSTASTEAILELQRALKKTRKEADDTSKTTENVAAVLAALNGVVGTGSDAINLYQSKFSLLVADMAEATRKSKELEQQTKSLADTMRVQAQLANNPAGLAPLSPLFSGGGNFMNANQFQSYKFDQTALREAGSSAAAEMIRGFESFVEKAYADKRTSTGQFDAWRVGFGSDTITTASGEIQRVTQQTVVTLADAERDLSRRIVEFQSGIQNAIGVETWKSLNDAQQAALTSIAYNYGSLPKSIVAAIQNGGGPQLVAQAIAKLTANPSRRKEEAQAFLSGSGFSMSDAGLGGSKSPADLFKGDVAEVQKRIDVLNAQYQAQLKLNPLINDYGYAVQKARIEEQLLADAKKAGLEITPQLSAQISQLAENYAKATAAGGMLAESNQKLLATMQQSSTFGKDVLGGFISDLKAGKSATEALAGALEKVANKLLDIALNSLFDGSKPGSGGGILGGLFSFLFAKGGVAANGRPQPLKTFARGGVSSTAAIFGETGRPEAAVPLPDGRRIPVDLRAPTVPPGSAGRQSVDVTVGVSADNNGNLMPFVESVSQRTAAGVTRQGIAAYDKQLDRSMGGKIAQAQSRQL